MPETSASTRYAVIAGSGFRGLAGDGAVRRVVTRFGTPSAPVRTLEIDGRTALLLARHGDDMSIPPHRINYRANAMALKLLGIDRIVALNTVGSVQARHAPGQLAVPAQLIDYTYGRDHSIYDGSSATLEHIDFSEPLCPELREALLAAAGGAGVECHDGGVYGVTQGPRLETAAEVDRLEKEGVDFIGMTAMPEASLARELGLRYACLSLIVNYAAGRGEKAIHDDIEASTESARDKATRVLRAFFEANVP